MHSIFFCRVLFTHLLSRHSFLFYSVGGQETKTLGLFACCSVAHLNISRFFVFNNIMSCLQHVRLTDFPAHEFPKSWKNIECIVCSSSISDYYTCFEDTFSINPEAETATRKFILRIHLTSVWHQYVLACFQLESTLSLFVRVLIRRSSLPNKHEKAEEVPCMIVSVIVTWHHTKRPCTQRNIRSYKPVVLGIFWMVLLMVVGGFGWFWVVPYFGNYPFLNRSLSHR